MTTERSSTDETSTVDRVANRLGSINPETVIAVCLAPFYGMVAFPPVIEVALQIHGEYVPLRAGALLGLLVPITFRCWRGRTHAIRTITFVLVATPLTFAIQFVMFDPLPVVRGSPAAAVEVALISAGAAALSLGAAWHLTDDLDS